VSAETDWARVARLSRGQVEHFSPDDRRPRQTAPTFFNTTRGRPGMIRLTVSYPSTEGATFDHDYYRDKHVPLAVRTWGLDGAEIDKGIDGPNVAAVHFKFESLDALGAAMGAAGTHDVLADVANYTSIAPVLQTSEMVE
jgi:uncharacterized protein (TIGR02118 family)